MRSDDPPESARVVGRNAAGGSAILVGRLMADRPAGIRRFGSEVWLPVRRRVTDIEPDNSVEAFSRPLFSASFVLLGRLHDLVREAALAEQARHGLHRRSDVSKEGLVAGAQVVEPVLAVGCLDEAVARALAVAGE